MNVLKKIVIHYPSIAKYRVPVFKLLTNDDKYSFEFWAGSSNNDPYLLTETNGINFVDIGFSIINVPFKKNKLEWQPKAIKKIFFENIDCYIILGNPNSLSNWIVSFIARIRKIPLLMWSHGYLKEEKGFKGLIRKAFYGLANGHLLYGNKAKYIMEKKGFKKENLHVVYNSLDYEMQKEIRDNLNYGDRVLIRRNLGINENSILLIAIGRVMSKLKLDQAIEAVQRNNSNGIDTVLLIIGNGPQKQHLEELTQALGISNKIIFYGACHDEERLSQLFNASDYSVVMGKVGLSAMHSLGYGIPMMTNNNMDEHFPEIEAIVENQTGFYFKEDDIEDFLKKIKPIEYRGKYYNKCIEEIEKFYTPEKQKMFIKSAISKYLEDK
jgi:glycosyltransferase involved in cell wall biosynthesis